MPLQYVRDDARRRIRITVTDPLLVADMICSVERQLSDRTWTYGLLVDLRAPIVPPTSSEMQSFATRVSELVAEHGRRGPIALIARDPRVVSPAQRLAFTAQNTVIAGQTESIEVFWDVQDGQRWLDEQDPSG
jgi:hypothetical protein